MERMALLGAAAAMGLAVSCYRAKRRVRRPMPGGMEVVWEKMCKKGEVRVLEGGVWIVNSFHAWEDVLLADIERSVVTVVMVDGWRVTVEFPDRDCAVDFLRFFRRRLYPDKPYTIHVIINPTSGKGNSLRTYDTTIKPILAASPHTITTYITTHQGHASELAAVLLLIKNDAIITIGGDGVFNEVVNGLLSRKDVIASDISLGIIPCGSGNGLAASIGTSTVKSACRAVVKGRTTALDVIKFTQKDEVRYGVLAVAAACIAEIDIKSEFLRVLGPIRFTLYGIYLILKKKSYALSFTTSEIESPTPSCGTVDFFVATSVSHIAEGTHIAPSAQPADGLLHTQWIASDTSTRGMLVRLFNQLEAGTGEHVLSSAPTVESTSSTEVIVEVGEDNIVTLDGEPMPAVPFKLICVPKKLKLLVP